MNARHRILALIVLTVWISAVCIPASGSGASQQTVPESKNEEMKAGSGEEKLVPSPKGIKERTAIYVFVGWMWLSILVLVYILRLKIKETDRVFRLKFFSKKRE